MIEKTQSALNELTRKNICRAVMPKTYVRALEKSELTLYRYLALRAISGNEVRWRHNGQGMLQGYLFEGESCEARLHIWHSDLRKDGIFDNGLLHDHRFNMDSFVIMGCVHHSEFYLSDTYRKDALGAGRIMSITNARKAKEATGSSYHMDPTDTGQTVTATPTNFLIENSVYYFPKFRFHKAWTSPGETTISIVFKSDQEDCQARLIDFSQQGALVNSFDDTLAPHQFQHILDDSAEALRALLRESK